MFVLGKLAGGAVLGLSEILVNCPGEKLSICLG